MTFRACLLFSLLVVVGCSANPKPTYRVRKSPPTHPSEMVLTPIDLGSPTYRRVAKKDLPEDVTIPPAKVKYDKFSEKMRKACEVNGGLFAIVWYQEPPTRACMFPDGTILTDQK